MQLGRYRLTDELGTGGMATVFAARDLELRRDVAVKVLFPHLARSREVVSRFHREARAAAGLDHRHILRVLDVGGGPPAGEEVDAEREVEPPYIVLELVRGANLAQAVGEGPPVMAEVVAAIGVALAAALGEAHRAGIVHRDVKPSNLLVAEGGRLVLADFGVARVSEEDSLVTRTGALLGTPAFMSPEQATAGELDARSDLYSMGATLYQLATGSLPVTGGPAKAVAAILAGEITPPLRRNRKMGAGLARIIERLMQVEPAARYASAAEVEAALRALLAESGVADDADAVVAEWAADRTACEARLEPLVLATTVRRAREAAERGEGPKALALCDRALALDPSCAEATEIAARVGRRGRGARIALVAGGATLAVVAGGFWILGEHSPQARALDAAPIAAADPDPDSGSEPEPEPEPVPVSDPEPDHELDHEHAKPRLTVRKPEVKDASPPPGTNVVVPDAGPPPPAKTGTLVVTTDAWCDLAIDDQPRVRMMQKKPRTIELAPGPHAVDCVGGDGLSWKTEVTVTSGRKTAHAIKLLKTYPVKIDIKSGSAIRVDGGPATETWRTLQLRRGDHLVEILWDGEVRSRAKISVSHDCTIKDTPRIACY